MLEISFVDVARTSRTALKIQSSTQGNEGDMAVSLILEIST